MSRRRLMGDSENEGRINCITSYGGKRIICNDIYVDNEITPGSVNRDNIVVSSWAIPPVTTNVKCCLYNFHNSFDASYIGSTKMILSGWLSTNYNRTREANLNITNKMYVLARQYAFVTSGYFLAHKSSVDNTPYNITSTVQSFESAMGNDGTVPYVNHPIDGTLIIFSDADNSGKYDGVEFYGMNIYTYSGTLIHEIVPWKNYDSKDGVKDLVTGNFYELKNQ